MPDSMDDDNFISYCEAHSETQRALFCGEQIERLSMLAGMNPPITVSGWHSIDLTPLCEKARERNQIEGGK